MIYALDSIARQRVKRTAVMDARGTPDNVNQYCGPQLEWWPEYVSYNGVAVRYSDVSIVSFGLFHTTKSVDFVKYNDTLAFEIRIDDIFVTRSDSAFNRLSQSAQDAASLIRAEYEFQVAQIYDRIVPGLFQRKALELMNSGEVKITTLRFRSDGTVIIGDFVCRACDLELTAQNGSWIIRDRGKRALFGGAKHVTTIPMSADNAALLEAFVRLGSDLRSN